MYEKSTIYVIATLVGWSLFGHALSHSFMTDIFHACFISISYMLMLMRIGINFGIY